MKALIRNEGETVTEDMDIPCIDWNTGYPLTGPKWFGGPYRMVQNYVEPIEGVQETYEEIVVEPEPVVEENEDAAPSCCLRISWPPWAPSGIATAPPCLWVTASMMPPFWPVPMWVPPWAAVPTQPSKRQTLFS